jgi:uncharacterized delta-60 repeat protein
VNALGVVAAALLAAASLDPSFDGDGTVLTDFGGQNSAAHSVAVQRDGKIVAAGRAGGDFAFARYNRDGSVDFATTTDLGGEDAANSVAVAADGKLVLGGTAGGDFALAWYDAAGTLERKVVTDLGGRDGISRVLLRAGRVVAVGVSGERVALVWYRPDGTVERRAFGPLAFPGIGVAPAPGGKIVVASPRVVDPPGTPNPRIDFRIMRFRADGRLDRTFSRDGIAVRRAKPHWTGGQSVAVQPDGRIIIVGHGHERFGPLRAGFGLIRFRRDGSLDRTFGEGGTVVSFVGWGARAVAIDAQGRIVVSGVPYKDGNEGLANLNDFTVARYLPNGALDRSFGAPTADAGAVEYMWALALQPDGRVVLAGQSGRSASEDIDFALARFR